MSHSDINALSPALAGPGSCSWGRDEAVGLPGSVTRLSLAAASWPGP